MREYTCFFESIIEPHRYKNIDSVLVVVHANVDIDSFLTALGGIVRIAGVLPKASSKRFTNLDTLKSKFKVIEYDRQAISSDPIKFLNEVELLIRNERFAIIDMGGYFSHVAFQMAERFEDRIVGVIEDTENGHQKYEEILRRNISNKNIFPIISVARSLLKEPEDVLVGQAIVFSAEAILRSHGSILLGKRTGVIGFGKIGRSIAYSLQSRGSRVNVFDSNPILVASALSQGFHTSSRPSFLNESEILFCATGNKSLHSRDEVHFKDGIHIFCATSSDDELSACLCKKIASEFTLIGTHTKKINFQNKVAYIHNEGNSINFIHGGVVDKFIELVQGEIIYAIGSLPTSVPNKISSLSDVDKRFIADKWISHYQYV